MNKCKEDKVKYKKKKTQTAIILKFPQADVSASLC